MRNRWFILLILFTARTAMGFQFQSVAALGPSLTRDLAIDYAQLGALVGLYMLPGVVVALPGGLLGQRFGDTRIAALGLVLMALGGAWIGMSESYPMAAAGRLMSGIGAVLLNIMIAKMVSDWFAGREIVTAMGLLLSSWPIGIGVALLSLAPISIALSMSAAFLTTAAGCLAALVLLLAFYAAPNTGAVAAAASFRMTLSRSEWQLAGLSGLVWALFNVGFILVLSFGPSFLTAAGLSLSAAGSLVSLVTWAILPALPLGGYFAERFGWPNSVMIACLLLTAACVCAIALGAEAWLFFILIGLLFGPPAGLIMKLPTEVLRPENRAAGMGIFYTCYYANMAALPPLAGLVRDMTRDEAAPLYFAALILVGAALALGGFRWAQRHATLVAVQ